MGGHRAGDLETEADRRLIPRRRRSDRSQLDLRLVASLAAGVGVGMLLFDFTEVVLARLQTLLIAVLMSLFLSFALEPAVQWLARRGMRRGLATGLAFVIGFVAVAGFLAAMAPLVVDQVRTLIESGPNLAGGLAARARGLPGVGPSIAGYLEGLSTTGPSGGQMMQRFGGGLVGFSTTLLGGILQLLTVLLVTFYLVADGPRLRRTLSSRLNPRRQEEVLAVWELAIEKTGGYVYGRALVAVASALFHAGVFVAIGLEYGLALGLWVGVLSSLIPVISTYLAGALPIGVALASEPILAVWVAVAVAVYQQVENYLVAPRITGHTMALHPAVAFVAVLAGGALLGAVGAFLALPAAAIIGALVEAAGERHEVVAHQLLEEVTD